MLDLVYPVKSRNIYKNKVVRVLQNSKNSVDLLKLGIVNQTSAIAVIPTLLLSIIFKYVKIQQLINVVFELIDKNNSLKYIGRVHLQALKVKELREYGKMWEEVPRKKMVFNMLIRLLQSPDVVQYMGHSPEEIMESIIKKILPELYECRSEAARQTHKTCLISKYIVDGVQVFILFGNYVKTELFIHKLLLPSLALDSQEIIKSLNKSNGNELAGIINLYNLPSATASISFRECLTKTNELLLPK